VYTLPQDLRECIHSNGGKNMGDKTKTFDDGCWYKLRMVKSKNFTWHWSAGNKDGVHATGLCRDWRDLIEHVALALLHIRKEQI